MLSVVHASSRTAMPLVRICPDTFTLKCMIRDADTAYFSRGRFDILLEVTQQGEFSEAVPVGITFHSARELLCNFEILRLTACISGRISVLSMILALRQLYAREGRSPDHYLHDAETLFSEHRVYVPWRIINTLMYDGPHLRLVR